MRPRKDGKFRPARRQVTFAWPAAAAAALFATVLLRWPRAPYTPVRAPVPRAAAPAMAYVETPPGAEGFLWPRDFTRGHTGAWPRTLEMDAGAQPAPSPPPFREWPAEDGPPLEKEAPAE